jgi:hypothetical protein
MTSVGSSLPAAGASPATCSTRAPVGFARTRYPAARIATAAAISCERVISRASAATRCFSFTPGARRADFGTISAPSWRPGHRRSSSEALRTKMSTK